MTAPAYPTVTSCARCGRLETAHKIRTDGWTRAGTDDGVCPGWEPGETRELLPESVLRGRLDAAEAALTWVGDVIATSARDWAASQDLALVYGVLLGWDNPDDPADDGALREIAALFPAGSKLVERMQKHRAAIRAVNARGES